MTDEKKVIERERKRKVQAAYRAKYPDKIREQTRKYYVENREKSRVRVRRFYANHPGVRAKESARWRAKNPTYHTEWHARQIFKDVADVNTRASLVAVKVVQLNIKHFLRKGGKNEQRN